MIGFSMNKRTVNIEEIIENKKLINVAQKTSIFMTSKRSISAIEEAKTIYDLNKKNDIPNLLSKEYKLR